VPYNFQPSTLFLGKKSRFVPTCHSTNDELAKMIQESGEEIPEGTVVATAHQTAGRGQRGNRWEAAPGENLTFSVLLKPRFLRATEQFRLSIAVALGVYETLRDHLDGGLKVKWPNDIFHENQKLGGLLIENTLHGHTLADSVVGIGLNVNQLYFGVPTATSLRAATGQPYRYDLDALLARLLECLEAEYLRLRRGDHEAQKARYLAALYRYQEWHPFRDAEGRLFNGKTLGVDEAGRLALQTESGVRYFGVKEVGFVG